MYVVMMGTGALGGLFAHHLALGGAEVLGVDIAPAHLAAACPDNPILYGLTTLTSDLVAPGVIEPLSVGAGMTDLWGDTEAARAQGAAFIEVLARGGLAARLAPDIRRSIWKKLAVNCALNPLCALTGLRCGELVDLPAMRPVLDTLADEVAIVAQALGVSLARADARDFVHQVAQASRRHYPSMAMDVRHGRRTEIESLCGAVLREADRLGLPAPALRQAYGLVSALDARLAS